MVLNKIRTVREREPVVIPLNIELTMLLTAMRVTDVIKKGEPTILRQISSHESTVIQIAQLVMVKMHKNA